MLSFKHLSEKKTKIKLNPKKEDVMEGDKTLNHGEDCGCMKCDKKRRKDELGDEKSVSTEQKIYDSNEEVSEESTESNAQSDNSETNFLTFNQFHEGSSYGLYKGSGKPSGPMAAFAKPTKPNPKAKKQRVKNVGVGEETKYEVMSKEKYKNTHKDFKGGTKKEPRVSVYDPEKKATVSRLVKFSEMCCATKPNPKAKKQRVANVGLTSEAKLEDVMTTVTPVTKKKELMHKIKKEETYIENTSQNIYGNQEEVSEKSNQSIAETKTSLVKFSDLSEVTRQKKEMGYVKGGTKKPTAPKQKDTALDFVKKQITAKYGKGAIMSGGSKQSKKVKGEKSTVGTGKYKKAADAKKQTAADAKKRGFKSTQDYVNTMARYGGKDNYDKGRGLGT